MQVAYETKVLTMVFPELQGFVLDQSKDLEVRRWFYRQMNEVYDEVYFRAHRGDKVAVEFIDADDGGPFSDAERAELQS